MWLPNMSPRTPGVSLPPNHARGASAINGRKCARRVSVVAKWRNGACAFDLVAIGVKRDAARGGAGGACQQTDRLLLIVVQVGGSFRATDLLNRHAAGAVDIAVCAVAENQCRFGGLDEAVVALVISNLPPHAERVFGLQGAPRAVCLLVMLLLPKTRSSQVLDRLTEMVRQLQESLRKLQSDVDSRLDTMTQAFESRSADEEAEAVAAERIRSAAAGRTQDGVEALSELGIHAR